MPLVFAVAVQGPILLEEKGAPTRYFVLVDHSGQFAPVVTEAPDREHQGKVWQALLDQALKQTRNATPAGSRANANAPGITAPAAEKEALLSELRG
jgi:hypothetical protein